MSIDKYFKQRKSIRSFSNREVTPELLDRILEAASKAPTMGNMQLYSVVETRRGESREQLEKLHFSQPASTGAPVLLTVCADFYMFSKWCKVENADPGYDNFLSFLSALTDAVILSQQIVTIAEMEGLGTCYLGTVLYNADKISELLKLPELVVPVCTIALGYPDGEGVATERLPIDAWRHKEVYYDFNDLEVAELYKVKDEYPANREFVKENGKETLAQLFTDIRYPRGLNRSVSDMLLKLLKAKKYL